MVGKPAQFKHHEVVRGLKAAIAAGVPNPSVEFHAADGSKVVVGSGRPAAAAPAKPARPPAVAVAAKPVAKPTTKPGRLTSGMVGRFRQP